MCGEVYDGLEEGLGWRLPEDKLLFGNIQVLEVLWVGWGWLDWRHKSCLRKIDKFTA